MRKQWLAKIIQEIDLTQTIWKSFWITLDKFIFYLTTLILKPFG